MNDNVKDAFVSYKRYKTRAFILEVMAMLPTGSDTSYKYVVETTIDNSLRYKSNIVETHLNFQYLITVGYISHNPQNDSLCLTDAGIQALQNCTLQNLALAAYNNYIDLKLKRLTIVISVLALVLSTISLML